MSPFHGNLISWNAIGSSFKVVYNLHHTFSVHLAVSSYINLFSFSCCFWKEVVTLFRCKYILIFVVTILDFFLILPSVWDGDCVPFDMVLLRPLWSAFRVFICFVFVDCLSWIVYHILFGWAYLLTSESVSALGARATRSFRWIISLQGSNILSKFAYVRVETYFFFSTDIMYCILYIFYCVFVSYVRKLDVYWMIFEVLYFGWCISIRSVFLPFLFSGQYFNWMISSADNECVVYAPYKVLVMADSLSRRRPTRTSNYALLNRCLEFLSLET